MARFLTTAGVVAEVEQIIARSGGDVTIVTPYLKLSATMLERLKKADRAGVRIKLVYGKNELKPAEQEKLTELKKLRLFYLKDLHAKCYANESHVIVSSMNLYEFSAQNNWEMGVLLDKKEDAQAFASACEEIDAILSASSEEQRRGVLAGVLGAVFKPYDSRTRRASAVGFCIRCSSKTRYQPQAPLCGTCYPRWAAWQNEDYPEQSCHRCGEAADVTKAKPLCYDCFREAPFSAPTL